ncbi:MAG: META domain-containing protein [Campylobacterota bacterium]|nr:META domain-containing protein [Campylobacterota bacterium]
MEYGKSIFLAVSLSLMPPLLIAKPVDLNSVSGNWHLRVMDGMEVRKARAIVEFIAPKMQLSGFDGCNRITGTLTPTANNTLSTKLMSTRMACREPIHSYVSQRLHQALNEGFEIKKEKKYGIEGITLKSATHELFFKKMQRE